MIRLKCNGTWTYSKGNSTIYEYRYDVIYDG